MIRIRCAKETSRGALAAALRNRGGAKAIFGTEGAEGMTWARAEQLTKKPGGGLKYFSFSPLFGEDSHFD